MDMSIQGQTVDLCLLLPFSKILKKYLEKTLDNFKQNKELLLTDRINSINFIENIARAVETL